MKAELFLDTAYAIALSAPTDTFHAQASHLAEQIETTGRKLVITRAVTLEIGNALSKQRYRRAAIRLLYALEVDQNVEIVPLKD